MRSIHKYKFHNSADDTLNNNNKAFQYNLNKKKPVDKYKIHDRSLELKNMHNTE